MGCKTWVEGPRPIGTNFIAIPFMMIGIENFFEGLQPIGRRFVAIPRTASLVLAPM